VDVNLLVLVAVVMVVLAIVVASVLEHAPDVVGMVVLADAQVEQSL
jgi:hypothetical protein